MLAPLLIASISVLAGLLQPARAASPEPLRADTLEPYRTQDHPVLALPWRAYRVLVDPLGRFVIYAERTELPRRVTDWFTNAERTFGLYPYAQLGGETGTGAGFTAFHTRLFGPGQLASATCVLSAPRRQTAEATYHDANVLGSRWYWTMQAGLLRTDSEDATINGFREALEDGGQAEDDAGLRLTAVDASSRLGWRPHAGALEAYRRSASVEVVLGYGLRDLGAPGPVLRPLPASGQTAAAARVEGLGERLSLFSAGVGLTLDDRDWRRPARRVSHPLNYRLPGRVLLLADDRYYALRDTVYPERGGLVRATAEVVVGTGDAGFLRLGAEGQRFVTLFYRDRILALRARLDHVDPLSGRFVPYVDLPTLGGGQRLRGFKRGSFRGRGALLLAAEYRWPIWDTWNAYVFWEEGQVFDEYSQVEGGRFRTSLGGGISLRTEQALLARVRVGHSAAEKALLGFALEQEF
ncbi:MAG: BamA/TamA family outer membrane protein [Candidatus Latescibacterota bacterium]